MQPSPETLTHRLFRAELGAVEGVWVGSGLMRTVLWGG